MSKTFEQHIEMARKGWDSYHPTWMEMLRKQHPGREERLAQGEVCLDADQCRTLGDLRGQRVLVLACGPDATQAFSLANLGAQVTACDLSPAAVEIARENAEKMGIDVEFVVAESQTLPGIADESFDLVYSDLCFLYYQDLRRAFKSWYRVLREDGRVFLREEHFVTSCLEETGGMLKVTRSYHDTAPEYCTFIGTPMAATHGWTSDLPDVEFSHTLAETFNALAQTGFVFERMVEPCAGEDAPLPLRQLPKYVLVVARKPGKEEKANKRIKRDQ
jgi:ubiquinone/menaquinone biosynthesis C-methylase UbiE